jgi:RHS repeat-associated protein
VTVSDKKLAVDSDGNGVVDYYNADVVTANDYYPYGMQMPGRKYIQPNSKYRYGFNGQENSDEIAAGLTTALYWEYDSRIGRRWNVDPIVKVWESPYLCFSGNPIGYSDPLGNDAGKPKKPKHNKKNTTGKMETRNADGTLTGIAAKPVLLEAVIVKSSPKKKNNSIFNPLDPAYYGWGEVRDVAIDQLEKNIRGLNSKISSFKPSEVVGSSALHVQRLNEKLVGNLIAHKALDAVNIGLDIWDVGVGMHAYATKGGDGDIFSGIPLFGGVFSVSNDMLEEQEKAVVNSYLDDGYSIFYDFMKGGSGAARRSGLSVVYVSSDVLKTVIKQAYLDLNSPLIGNPSRVSKDGYDRSVSPAKQFNFLLVFPSKNDGKITQFVTLPIN